MSQPRFRSALFLLDFFLGWKRDEKAKVIPEVPICVIPSVLFCFPLSFPLSLSPELFLGKMI